MLKTRAWVEICSLVLKPDFFIPCFPNLKEKSYLFLCVKVQCFKCIGAIIINGGFSGGGGGLVCFLIVNIFSVTLLEKVQIEKFCNLGNSL